MLPEKIITERLLIRKPVIEDNTVIYEKWAQDNEVTKYLMWKPHPSPDVPKQFIELSLERWKKQEQFPYMICLKETGEIIGMIDARIESFKSDIGYVLAKANWNKGYMTEALKALINELLKLKTIYRVWCTCDIENKASEAVMKKAGMKYEGTLKKWIMHPNISETVPRDCLVYAITK